MRNSLAWVNAFFKVKTVVEMATSQSWETASIQKLREDAAKDIPGAREAYNFFGSWDGDGIESLEALLKSELPYVLAVLIPFRITYILLKP